jgi:conserved hypothetical protein
MKRKIFRSLVVLSSAIILIILIFFTNSWEELTVMISKARLYWLAVAFGCMILYWLFDAVILHVITRGLLEKQPLRDTIRVTMIGQFFNAITPLAGAGQPVQAVVMVKDGIKPGHAGAIIIIKSLLHQLLIVTYALVVFLSRGHAFASKVPQFLYFFVLAMIINTAFLIFYILFIYNKTAARKVLLFVFKFLKKLKFLKISDKWKEQVTNELESFGEGVTMLKTDIGVSVKLIISQIMQFTFYFSIPFFIQLAIEGDRAFAFDMIAAQCMIIFISLLVPSPGATGGIEGLSYLFYGMFFTRGYIIPVILIYRILTYYSSIIFGGLFSLFAPEKPLKNKEVT